MEKQKVDMIISEFFHKIYGFAVKKSFSYDEAEELCAQIIQEVYFSLLKKEKIINVEGYIWRISEHIYSRYVSQTKKHQGISMDGFDIPVEYDFIDENDENILKLRREITYLTKTRRQIVYSYYYNQNSIQYISKMLNIPAGTVKWHLNKAKIELREGFKMERKIGKLGMSPVEWTNIGHNGNEDPGGYIGDKLNLNIVYSVYYKPKKKEEIAEELGVSLPYIEDTIQFLENNGFLVRQRGNKYTTYVCFEKPYSLELEKTIFQTKQKVAKRLAKEYVPSVRNALKEVKNIYIPSGNRELFEAAAIFWGIVCKCYIPIQKDISKYKIKTMKGGEFVAYVELKYKPAEGEYVPALIGPGEYWSSGLMIRESQKYPDLYSWSVDSRLSSRIGWWQNNYTHDYEYLYEFINGTIGAECEANKEKYDRLRKRQFITEDGKINIMVVKGKYSDLFDKIPGLDEQIEKEFANIALDFATQIAKSYPPQMQDLVIHDQVVSFIGIVVAIMTMDILYQEGIFKSLTSQEKLSANLLMFSDILPR